MLRSRLIHPDILRALGAAGHGSRVLIADGNFPASTSLGPNAALVHLNLSPGILSATQVLEAVADAIPIEAAAVMAVLLDGPYAMDGSPPIWSEFRAALGDGGVDIQQLERHAFYQAARSPDVCLSIQTGDERLYANLLLTLGVSKQGPGTSSLPLLDAGERLGGARQ